MKSYSVGETIANSITHGLGFVASHEGMKLEL